MTPTSTALLLTALLTTHCWSRPFDVTSPSEIRADTTFSWEDIALARGSFFTTDVFGTFQDSNSENASLFPKGGGGEILSSASYMTPGPLLQKNGGGLIFFYPSRPVQGFAVTLESSANVPITYTLTFFKSDGTFLYDSDFTSSGNQGGPVFCGAIDPEARVGIAAINTPSTVPYAISDPIFQLKPAAPLTLSDLPAISTFAKSLSQFLRPLLISTKVLEAGLRKHQKLPPRPQPTRMLTICWLCSPTFKLETFFASSDWDGG